MAAVTHRVSTASTTNAASYTSGSFTPAANDLLVAFVMASGTVAPGVMTDSQNLGWARITTALARSSADTLYLFVAKTLAANSSMTVTFDCSGDAATGAVIFVASVSSMSLLGANAVRQTAIVSNHASGTPAPVFSSACLTGNPTLGLIGNATNPATMTPPTSWTEQADTGYATPTTGAEYVSRDSGFTGTTVTWGSSSASAFGSIIVELNTQTAPTVALNTTDGITFSSLTPTVEFTGTDAGSNDITYELQVDTVNTFDSASPTPAFVQSVSATETTGTGSYTSSAFGLNTTSGNLIVVTVADDSFAPTGTTVNVTDSKGNLYTRIGTAQESNTVTGQTVMTMWYSYNITGGASHTVTVSYDASASNNNSFVAQEFSGFGTTDPLDKTTKSSGASTSPSSGATSTLSQSNELVVSGMACDTVQTPTAGSGYSNLAQNGSGTPATQAAQESKVVASTSAVTGTFTITSTNWACTVATFKANNVPLLDKLSASDLGFLDETNALDTDPFASGDKIGHTFQASLSNSTTYYWRVRGKDPAGSNTFGDYPTTRSFLISIGGAVVSASTMALMGVG